MVFVYSFLRINIPQNWHLGELAKPQKANKMRKVKGSEGLGHTPGRLLFADGHGCRNFLPVPVHCDARSRRLAVLASDESLGRHPVSAEDSHHGFDFLLASEAHFFHPNLIIRLPMALETPPKSSSSQNCGRTEPGFSGLRNPSIWAASLALPEPSEMN